jgi:hypothetical protein
VQCNLYRQLRGSFHACGSTSCCVHALHLVRQHCNRSINAMPACLPDSLPFFMPACLFVSLPSCKYVCLSLRQLVVHALRSAGTALAGVIVMDQFTRNAYRGSTKVVRHLAPHARPEMAHCRPLPCIKLVMTSRYFQLWLAMVCWLEVSQLPLCLTHLLFSAKGTWPGPGGKRILVSLP